MKNYFFRIRINSDKGQAAPIFIALIMVIIIMAIVTVNLGKVALIKTESANAVDSGALAAGSVMANLFNAIGLSNRDMEEKYWMFYDAVSVMYIDAIDELVTSYIDAYEAQLQGRSAIASECPGALSHTRNAIIYTKDGITAQTEFNRIVGEDIIPEVDKYHQQTDKFYNDIRTTAEKGWHKARNMGHKFTFMNSGLGKIARAKLNSVLSRLNGESSSQETMDIAVVDNQIRPHDYKNIVQIKEVNKFYLRVTRNTYSEESAQLQEIVLKGEEALSAHNEALNSYMQAMKIILRCLPYHPEHCHGCPQKNPPLKVGIMMDEQVLTILKPLFTLVPTTWRQLLPDRGTTFYSSSSGDASDQIICWIDEIEHDRLVRVDNTQIHGGAEIKGLWNTVYPTTKSNCIVNFRGKGQIYRSLGQEDLYGTENPQSSSEYEGPVLRHNPSIIETDNAN